MCKMCCDYWSPAEQSHPKNVFYTTEKNGKLKHQNALTAITPSLPFSKHLQKQEKGRKERKTVQIMDFFFPGNL